MGHGHRRAGKLIAGASLLLLSGLVGGACSGLVGGDDSEAASTRSLPESEAAGSEEGGGAVADVAATKASGAGGGGGGAPGNLDLGAPVPEGLGSARVVKTASIDVEVEDGGFAAAFSKVATIAAGNGGFVAESSSHQSGDGDSRGDGSRRQAAGSAVVRVPSANFDAARQAFVELGELRSQQLGGEDVGGRLTDLEARLRNLRSHEEAVRLLMTKAANVGETIEVQRQLSGIREQIEQLSAEQARLTDAVEYSMITLSLSEPGVAVSPNPDGTSLGDAFADAVEGAEDVVAGVIVTLGYLVPLALLAGAVWLVARPLVHRRRPGAVVPTPAP